MRAELLHVEVAEAAAPADVELGERHRQDGVVGPDDDVVDHGGLGALAHPHHQAGEHGDAGAG